MLKSRDLASECGDTEIPDSTRERLREISFFEESCRSLVVKKKRKVIIKKIQVLPDNDLVPQIDFVLAAFRF